MKTALETQHILDKLEAQHPGADTELHHSNAFELLVATILSAQSTDRGVNLVTPALFKRYPTARKLARATSAVLEPQIHSTGFFRAKSKALISMAQALVRDHNGEVPPDLDALVQLPGVGRKTANVVLGHALGVPGLPVDRHVLRVANRIGIARGEDPEVVGQQLYAASSAPPRARRGDPPRPTPGFFPAAVSASRGRCAIAARCGKTATSTAQRWGWWPRVGGLGRRRSSGGRVA